MDTGTALDQRTDDWYAARVGKVTASRAAAALGISPFASREGLLRSMIQEYHGERPNISSPAMDWGNEHEDTCIAEYERNTGQLVISTGLHASAEYPWLAASPDGLVGDVGLIECKCPYSQKIKTLAESPHYAIQVQIQLFVTAREWCDFVVWTPGDLHCERAYADAQMMAEMLPKLKAFHEEYEAIVADEKLAKQYRLPTERDDAEWADAARRLQACKIASQVAASEEAAAKEELIRLSGGDNVTGAGCTVSHYVRSGSIDYKAAEAAGLDLSPYRKPSSISTRVTIK